MNKIFKVIDSILDYDKRNKLLNHFSCNYDKDISEDAFELYEYLRYFYPNISYFHGLTRMAIIIPDCKYIIKVPFRGVYKENKFFKFEKNYCEQEYRNYDELSSRGLGKFFAETACLNLNGYTFEFQEKCLPWKEFQHNISKTDMEKAIKLKKKFIALNADINLPYVFIAELIKVYGENDCDKNDWTIEGEPNTNLVITRPSTVELTCAAIVNRIPDVINAPSGFVPTSRMGEMKYLVK